MKREDLSTSSGGYSFPLLDIGEYSVTVEAAGFKPANRAGLKLQVAEKLRADITLQIGQVSERVEVTGSTTALRTDDSSFNDVIEQKRIVELPVGGLNLGNLGVLQAGVMFGSRGGSRLRGRRSRLLPTASVRRAGMRRWTAWWQPKRAPTRFPSRLPRKRLKN